MWVLTVATDRYRAAAISVLDFPAATCWSTSRSRSVSCARASRRAGRWRGAAEVSELALPPTLRLTILRRISFLPQDALQALRAVSILGSSFTLTDLATVTGRSAAELSVVLAEPIRAQVLADDGPRLRFRHDLIRDAIYEVAHVSSSRAATGRPARPAVCSRAAC